MSAESERATVVALQDQAEQLTRLAEAVESKEIKIIIPKQDAQKPPDIHNHIQPAAQQPPQITIQGGRDCDIYFERDKNGWIIPQVKVRYLVKA